MLLLVGAALAAELPHRVHLDLAFAHWFGATSGSPDGLGTPAVALGVQPGLAFVDVELRYSLAVSTSSQGAAGLDGSGFASLALLAQHELRVDRSAAVLHAGPLALLHHDAAGALTAGYGLSLDARLLFDVGEHLHLGPLLRVEVLFYTLPEDEASVFTAPRREAQIDLGLSVAAF